jgi:hypothetical protein
MLVTAGGGTTTPTVSRAAWNTTAATYTNGTAVSLPGHNVFTLQAIANVPNGKAIGHKVTSDINYVLVQCGGADTLPGGGTSLILADNSADLGTFNLQAPAGGSQWIQLTGAGAPGASASAGPLMVAPLLGAATVGSAYSGALVASGGTPGYTYSLSVGSLPAGLSLNASTGAITGTPTTAGVVSFTGMVTDSASNTATASCTITVSAVSGIGTPETPYLVTVAELSSSRILSLSDQTTSTTLQIVIEEAITPTGGLVLGTQLHVQLSRDGGTSWYDAGQGVYPSDRVHVDGTSTYYVTTINITKVPVWAAAQSVQARAWALTQSYDGGTATATASTTYTLTAVAPPIATGATITIKNMAGLAPTQANIYMGTNGLGNPYAQVVLTVTFPGATADPNLWFYWGWVEWTDASGTPINPGGVANTSGWNPGQQFVNNGVTQQWTLPINYPATGVNGYLKIKVWGFNRAYTATAPTSADNWSGDANVVLQTAFGTSGTYLLHVGPPPALTVSYSASTIAQLTVTYSGSVTVSGGTGPYTYALASGSLPTGLSLNTATGAITGTPTVVGSKSFTIAVTDSLGALGAVSATIAVSSAAGAPFGLNLVFSGGGGTVGTAYSAFVEALSGTGPYTYALHSGTLPTGVSLNTSTGALTGTPSASGTFSFSIQVTDSLSATANLAIQIIIGGYGTLTASFSGSHAQFGVSYIGAVQASGGKPTYSYSQISGTIAPGLSLSGTTGAITGTPTYSGTWTFVVQVTDSLAVTVNVTCVITVTAAQISVVGQITSVSASVSLTGVHNDQSTTAQIQISPVFAVGTTGVQRMDVWAYYRKDVGGGLSWYWIQNSNVLIGGSVYIILPVVPGAAYSGQIAVMAGSTNGDPTIALGGGPPAGVVYSSGFSMGIVAPAGSAVTGATVDAVIGGVTNADGIQTWAIPGVHIPMPGNASPNCRYVSLTFMAVNALGTAAAASAGGTETEIDRIYNLPGAFTAVSGALNPGYGYQNRNAYGYHYARLKLYAVDFNATGWNDVSGHSVVQTNPWGIGTSNKDVDFGVAPAGLTDPTRLDPTLLGRYLANNPSSGNPAGDLVVPSDNFGHSIIPDWSFEYSTTGALANTGLPSPQSQWLSGAGSNAIRNDGGNSGSNYIRLTGPNCTVWQSIAIVGASGVDGQACYFRLALRSSNSGTGVNHQFGIGVVAFNSAGAVVNVNGSPLNNIVSQGYIASWVLINGMILQMPSTVARLQVLLQTSSTEVGYWDVDDITVQPVTNQSAGGQNNSQIPTSQSSGNTALSTISTSTTANADYGISVMALNASDAGYALLNSVAGSHIMHLQAVAGYSAQVQALATRADIILTNGGFLLGQIGINSIVANSAVLQLEDTLSGTQVMQLGPAGFIVVANGTHSPFTGSLSGKTFIGGICCN